MLDTTLDSMSRTRDHTPVVCTNSFKMVIPQTDREKWRRITVVSWRSSSVVFSIEKQKREKKNPGWRVATDAVKGADRKSTQHPTVDPSFSLLSLAIAGLLLEAVRRGIRYLQCGIREDPTQSRAGK